MLTAYAEVFAMTEDEVMKHMTDEDNKVLDHMNVAWSIAKAANFAFAE
jgi:RNase P/RNase MRP subunit p30